MQKNEQIWEVNMKRRVVVTGLGAVTPIGNNVKDMWESVVAGKCGIAPITHYDTTCRKVCLAGEVKDFHPEEYVEKSRILWQKSVWISRHPEEWNCFPSMQLLPLWKR